MNKIKSQCIGLILVLALAPDGSSAQDAAVPEAAADRQYLQVKVDRVVVDTAGLVAASAKLATAIETLGSSIERLSTDSAGLSAADKQTLLNAVGSVDRASIALAELARQLPISAQNLTDQLPRVVSEARQPIAELSSGLQSAREGIYAITDALPEATENAKQLMKSTLDAALWRLSIFAVVLFAILALTLIAVSRYIYRAYLDPIAIKLEALANAPEHFAAMSLHMRDTSANLLAMRTAASTDPTQIEAVVKDDPSPPAADPEPRD